ncbi:OsmC family protein [Kribbella flavida DSM 17836]|uniref:OsmC family protein n=1 Tax=Kribbella flavida (strain DSM 17836 / JCM 10339 / NBRC 14399) TaxID=479435 RepID=D2PW61_KRIFD|nr:OsmC family protein [Kribbella flavida]ADB31513.1 OsmC family protein [Kribbella flavida DSM 17836]
MTDSMVAVELDRSRGGSLEALLALPSGEVRAYAVLAHRSAAAAAVIAETLAGSGLAVLLFESTDVEDVVRAADHLRANFEAPSVLIGHSAGGVAVLAASRRIAETRAVVTVNAPSGEIPPAHTALLVMHAPTDQVVGIQHAGHLFVAARHPKSFIALDGADHLLSDPADAAYAAAVLAAWVARHLPAAGTPAPSAAELAHRVVVTESADAPYGQRITAGRHQLTADEPVPLGKDTGPTPYDLLLAALGACTSMTLRMYAERKQLPLRQVSVQLRHARIHATDCENCETAVGLLDRIDVRIQLDGDLTDEQRDRLLAIAGKCPVHRTLHSEVQIRTSLDG